MKKLKVTIHEVKSPEDLETEQELEMYRQQVRAKRAAQADAAIAKSERIQQLKPWPLNAPMVLEAGILDIIEALVDANEGRPVKAKAIVDHLTMLLRYLPRYANEDGLLDQAAIEKMKSARL